jgi:hypothetical protein
MTVVVYSSTAPCRVDSVGLFVYSVATIGNINAGRCKHDEEAG